MTEFGIHVHAPVENLEYDDQLNDCNILSNDGTRIPANTYVMTTSSRVLQTCFKDTGDREFYVDCDSETIRMLVNMLHGKHVSWSTDTARRVLKCMDYLDCHMKYIDVVDILWDCITCSEDPRHIFTTICEHAEFLAPTRLRSMIHVATASSPLYSDFREIFKHMTITPDLGRALMDTLLDIFPPLHVFYDIVMATTEIHRYDVAMAILTIPNIGIGFHPDEFHVALRIVYDISTQNEYSVTLLLKSCLDAFGSVNHPSVSTKVWGSFLSYRGPRASYLLNFMRQPHGKHTVRFHGCQFVIDTSASHVDIEATIFMEKVTYDDIDTVCIRASTIRHQRDMTGVIGPVSKTYDFNRHDDRVFSLRTVDPLNWGKISFDQRFEDPETMKFIRFDVSWT
jgi:hypothetical protein